MPHDTPLIATIAIGLALAFVMGLLAQRLRLPPIAGYLLTGIIVGPFTPGFVADQKLATQLAEIGVILLMFGVGLHFSLRDLMSVRAIAIPGAIAQIAVATLLGMGLAHLLGWSWGAGLVFGLSLSVASTVVLLRALQERRLVETERGRIAVGWLIVEDLVMVITLVLLPALAGMLGGAESSRTGVSSVVTSLGLDPVTGTLVITAVKVGLFVALMLIVGRRIIPWVLHDVAHTGSRELFRLAVFAIALGVAYGSAALFGVSFALGAFFAGMVLAESQLSSQAAREILPLRDAFAVLFFVSVGMLLNPMVLVESPLSVIATFLIIVIGKSLAAYAIVRLFGHPNRVALTISASLAQIGEFSFILVVLGISLQILPSGAKDLVVAGAILSILVNPLLFFLLDRFTAKEESQAAPSAPVEQPQVPQEREEAPTELDGHAILVGHGSVGSLVSDGLLKDKVPFLAVVAEPDNLDALHSRDVETFVGPCGESALLERLNLSGAKWLIIAIPDAFEAGHIVEAARAANPKIRVIARAVSTEAADYLRSLGADDVFLGEEEIAKGILESVQESRERSGGGQMKGGVP